ncbi:MAG: bifunctional phosphoserine phosphatase/homoserine phosphotransferase ThrH [Spirochaetaceae bacterium]|jgi:phosphoserine/homoserine phosphotransferase|nr:bifunctional phosphoserine phosphatase/homoserine phosphotransferase ThrH [Spirochaetaceae bacterium]
MRLVCLDLEGVLIPEIWIAFSEAVGIPELRRTTRDEPDYDRLMRFRLDLLAKNKLKLPDIQRVISGMEPLEGALEFTETLRQKTQLIILSDTYEEFAKPLMKKLLWPTLFCNSLAASPDGTITGYRLRQKNGKQLAVKALASLNMEVFAAGDSFNDLAMIREAQAGCLFRAPQAIRDGCAGIPCVDSYDGLLSHIERFLAGDRIGEIPLDFTSQMM